jgi:hypothetical protein
VVVAGLLGLVASLLIVPTFLSSTSVASFMLRLRGGGGRRLQQPGRRRGGRHLHGAMNLLSFYLSAEFNNSYHGHDPARAQRVPQRARHSRVPVSSLPIIHPARRRAVRGLATGAAWARKAGSALGLLVLRHCRWCPAIDLHARRLLRQCDRDHLGRFRWCHGGES